MKTIYLIIILFFLTGCSQPVPPTKGIWYDEQGNLTLKLHPNPQKYLPGEYTYTWINDYTINESIYLSTEESFHLIWYKENSNLYQIFTPLTITYFKCENNEKMPIAKEEFDAFLQAKKELNP